MRRLATVLGIAAILIVVMALPAAAHVTVSPSEATKGGFATLTFQVPNEDPDSKTVKLQVQFPADSAIPYVSVEPVPGWTAEITKKDLDTPIEGEGEGEEITQAVESITWTAASGGGVGDGEFQRFPVSMGTLPEDVDELAFPAIQTYSNGDVVEWKQATPEGGPEPDYPVPVVTLVEGEEHGGGGEATTTTVAPTDGSASGSTSATTASTVDQDDVDSAKTLAIVALVIGIVGVLIGIGGFVVGRRGA